MELVVLGSNGRLGSEVIRQALGRAHRVRAVVRSPDRDVVAGAEPVVGDPCDEGFLGEAMRGADAVLSTLGPRRPSASACEVYPRSGRALAAGLDAAGVRRLIVTSTGLLFPHDSLGGRVLRWVVPNVAAHAQRMEEAIRESRLAWTIARTDFLTMADHGTCRVGIDRMPAGGGAVSRQAVASVLLDAVEQNQHVGRTLGLCGA